MIQQAWSYIFKTIECTDTGVNNEKLLYKVLVLQSHVVSLPADHMFLKFYAAIGHNLSTLLYVSVRVEEVESSWEFDALTATKDEMPPVIFEMPVMKISKTHSAPQPRMLAMTNSQLLERDPATKRTLCSYGINHIFNLVKYADDPSKFAIEYKSGRTKRYQCLSCAVNERSSSVGVGFGSVDEDSSSDTRSQAVDPAATGQPEVVGSMQVFSAAAARDVVSGNIKLTG